MQNNFVVDYKNKDIVFPPTNTETQVVIVEPESSKPRHPQAAVNRRKNKAARKARRVSR